MIVAASPDSLSGIAYELLCLRADRKWKVWIRDGYLWWQRYREAEGMTAWAEMYAHDAATLDRRINEIDEQIARLEQAV